MQEPSFGLIFGWLAFVVVASVVVRKLRGKPIWYPPANGRFVERMVSGVSHKAWYTRMARVRNALVVVVTDEHLLVRPFFPFNLMFLAEIYDLEHQIPLDRIESVEAVRRSFRPGLEVTYRRQDNTQSKLTLHLSNDEGFKAALKPTR